MYMGEKTIGNDNNEDRGDEQARQSDRTQSHFEVMHEKKMIGLLSHSPVKYRYYFSTVLL
jgi:hypothetical protein